jgi:hypothetical protein
MKKLMLLAMVLLISTATANYEQKYKDQVQLNYKLDGIITKQDSKIKDLQMELAIKEKQNRQRYLLRVPFTSMGITNEHAQGFLVGCLVVFIIK